MENDRDVSCFNYKMLLIHDYSLLIVRHPPLQGRINEAN
jgi:hypothetical protein